MKIITSLSPKESRRNRQWYCINSWINNLKAEVVCIQAHDEIGLLKDFDNVQFVEFKTDKPLLEDVVDCYNDCDIDFIINSDIELAPGAICLEKYSKNITDSLLYIRRWDYNNNNKYNCKIFPWGIDGFCFDRKKKTNPFRGTSFSLGQPWWDYVLPWHFMNTNQKLYCVHGIIALHQNHTSATKPGSWDMNGKAFLDLFDIKTPTFLPDAADYVLGKILSETIPLSVEVEN
jgi:hypothetical protein